MGRVRKVLSRIERAYIQKLNLINVKKYMKKYNKWLRKQGVNITDYDGVGYIDPSAYLDGSDYSRITIGRNVTISKEVIILTHDFSIWNGMIALDRENEKKRYEFLKKVQIGENCFIGARAFILPGTVIGNNVIVGAASVVNGTLPDNTVWAGNPARQICTIEEFTQKHISKKDFERV
jgi:acetyltransferase-like isoleucine patch superfamily enzyme